MKRSALLVLFLVVFIDLVGFGIVLPLLPRYAAEHHVSGFEQGVLMASFSAMQFLFAPLWGRLSDRIGRRPVLMIGLAGSVLAYSGFAIADSYAILLATRIAAGIFGATIGTASAYIADVTTPETRGKGMALIGAAFGIGFTVGPMIGAFTNEHASIEAIGFHGARWLPGAIAAGFSAIGLILAIFVLPEPERHRDERPGSIFGFGGLRHVLATPTLPLVVGLQVAATFVFAMFESTLSRLTLSRFEMNETANGKLFGFVGLCLVIAQGAVVRRLMPKVGELNFVVFGTALLSAGLMGVAWAPTPGMIYPALAVLVFGFAMVTPSLSSLLSRRSPATIQGEVLGVNQSGLSLARVAAPLCGNVLLDRGDSLPALAGAGGMLLCFVGAVMLRARPVADSAPAGDAPPSH